MKNITKFLLGILTCVVIIQCSPNDPLTKDNDYRESQKISSRGCFELTAQQAEDLGAMHNLLLGEILSNLTCHGSIKEDVEQAVITVGEDHDINSNIINKVIDSLWITYDINNYEEEFTEFDTVRLYLSKINYAIMNCTDYDDLTDRLSLIKNKNEANLSCYDHSYVLACLSIASYSGYFWMPNALGGEGNYVPCAPTVITSRWRTSIAADVLGMGLSFHPTLMDCFTPWLQTVTDVMLGGAAISAACGSGGGGGGSW